MSAATAVWRHGIAGPRCRPSACRPSAMENGSLIQGTTTAHRALCQPACCAATSTIPGDYAGLTARSSCRAAHTSRGLGCTCGANTLHGARAVRRIVPELASTFAVAAGTHSRVGTRRSHDRGSTVAATSSAAASSAHSAARPSDASNWYPQSSVARESGTAHAGPCSNGAAARLYDQGATTWRPPRQRRGRGPTSRSSRGWRDWKRAAASRKRCNPKTTAAPASQVSAI